MTEQDTKNADGSPKPGQTDLLRQMANVVGHEIRNPLAIISNSLYFIKAKLNAGGTELDPKLAKHLGIIEGEIKRGNGIIEEILIFSRNRELNRTPAHVNALIKDLTSYYQFPPSVKVETVPDPSDPRADMDVEAITHAARCILDNAVQAMPDGGTVTIEVSSSGDGVLMTITDTGPGLPEGDGEKVFEPFFTTKPRGVGLGLTIARKFAEQHGGTAKAANAPGGGARITLCLPPAK